MIKSRRGHSMEEGVTLNLDSLVDIVSNSVGILIILAVFMALFSYLEFTPETTPDTRVSENPEKILIPWAHYSQKTALLFLVRDNRILRLDRSEYYRKLRKQLNGPNPSPPQSLSFQNTGWNSKHMEVTTTALNSIHLQEPVSGGTSSREARDHWKT